MWDVNEKGFLPLDVPLTFLPINDIRNQELVHTWENLSCNLPNLLRDECVREELICILRKASQSYYHGFVDNLGDINAYERAFFLLAYFATAYINSPEGKKKKKLPKEITVPFARAAWLVGRQPVLDYTSYVLYNWKLNHNDDIEPLHTFTDSVSEKTLLTELVKVEFMGIELVKNLSNVHKVLEILIEINNTLTQTTFTNLLEEVFTDYQDLVYEHWRPDALNFPCDVFLQSPLLATLYKYLDINFQNEYLRNREGDLQRHRPVSHRNFIDNVAGVRGRCHCDNLKEIYNNCLSELIKLRGCLAVRNADKKLAVIASDELCKFYFV